jgi:hypothetical protein
MAIPDFTEYGFIPPGTHRVTLEELSESFSTNDERNAHWESFLNFYEFILGMNCFCAIEFFGSFFSSKKNPGDIDLALEFCIENHTDTMDRDIFNKDIMRDRFNVDVTLKQPDNQAYQDFAGDDYKFASKNLMTFRTLKKDEAEKIGFLTKQAPAFGISYKGILRFEINP